MSLLAQLNLAGPARTGMPPDVFEGMRALIYEKTGIYFQDHKQYLLESRVSRRLGTLGLSDFRQYFAHLRNGGMRTELPELPELINAITINETFFFRNPAQFEVIEQELIPELVAERERTGQRRIRLWSAACSTGEEPYTLALLVKHRLQPRYPHIRFEIYGTDIDTTVLDTARTASYGPYAMRNVAPEYLRYFRKEGETHHLNPEVKRLVTFRHLNLMDRNGMVMLRGMDVILCANVLIYFDEQSKQQVIASLYNTLNPGGHLMVGFSETLYGVTQAFTPIRFAKTITYKKG